jgi:hypothetical protein
MNTDAEKLVEEEAEKLGLIRIASQSEIRTDAFVAIYTKPQYRTKNLCVTISLSGLEMLQAKDLAELVKVRVKDAALTLDAAAGSPSISDEPLEV